MTFEYKYLKYKKKYLELKYGQYGSSQEIDEASDEELPQHLPAFIRGQHRPLDNQEYIVPNINLFQNELKEKLQSMQNKPKINDLIKAIEEYFVGDNKKKLGKQIRGFIPILLDAEEESFRLLTLHVPDNNTDAPYISNLYLSSNNHLIGSFINNNNYKYQPHI
jgi:hypothetical protein